jgi:hypothetical protein
MDSKKRITVYSDFHNTETYVLARYVSPGVWRINARQWAGVKRRLCVPGCTCPIRAKGYDIGEGTSFGRPFELHYDFEEVE